MVYMYKDLQPYLDEDDLRERDIYKIAGVDEAGRGPGAGPVVVACVMLSQNHEIKGLKDSKRMAEKRREETYGLIMNRALSVSIAMATNNEIDNINILEATKKCVYKAIANMKVSPHFVVIDGLFDLENLSVPHICIPGADGAQIYEGNGPKKKQIGHHYENVAAASIIAKVYRDNLMKTYDDIYPQYGFKQHKGYLTKEHYDALKKYGPCPIHRTSFKGVIQ